MRRRRRIGVASRLSPRARRWPRRCRRCWSPPSGSPPRSARACTAGAGSARARPSGSSAATSPATRRTRSTGGSRRNPTGSMSARPNGRRRRASGCGATLRLHALALDAGLPTKRERAELLTLALAALLVRGGEHVALLGGGLAGTRPRRRCSRLAAAARRRDATSAASLPATEPLPRYARLVLIGDFLVAARRRSAALVAGFSRRGVRGHLVQILDPGRGDAAVRRPGPLRRRGERRASCCSAGSNRCARTTAPRFAAHREALQRHCPQRRLDHLAHRTDQPPETALLALYLALAEPAARYDALHAEPGRLAFAAPVGAGRAGACCRSCGGCCG